MSLVAPPSVHSEIEPERAKLREIYVQKKGEHDGISHALTKVIQQELGIEWVTAEVYDKYYVKGGDAAEGLSDEEFETARKTIFAELPLDNTFGEDDFYGSAGASEIIDVADVPGQFSQRTNAVEMSLLAQTGRDFSGKVKSNHVILLKWDVTDSIRKKIHDWVINPVEKIEQKKEDPIFPDSEKSPESYRILDQCAAELDDQGNPIRYEEFNKLTHEEYRAFAKHGSISLDVDDFLEVQKYFRDVEERNPTYTELKLIETYWSDHCRHTTFHTAIESIGITWDSPEIMRDIAASQWMFEETLGNKDKTLMNLALAGFKKIEKDDNLWKNRKEYDSLENNACSYETEIENENWEKEKWVIMFKNETHNSPTETEPFGGAATCIGGCIRDPLSGGTYTFQAMRISGSGNPTEPLDVTMAGKLSQRFISLVSALGNSSYGNQIGLATGMVREFFHPDFKAKHLELGYVVAAAPLGHNKRSKPNNGDIVLMIGGRTGRDGKGGATVSSKEQGAGQDKHQMGAHVQKGNAPEERKLQRLFLDRAFAGKIIKCNDFGAGGVSVAVGELAEGLDIDLDTVLTKYSGLSDEDLAHSESQERMAVVINPENYDDVMARIKEENLEAVQVATVTDDEKDSSKNRLRMNWKWNTVVDISRDFLNTMWAKKSQKRALLKADKVEFFNKTPKKLAGIFNTRERFLANLERRRVSSQKGLGSIFDSSVGASTILAPYGGRLERSPQIGMAAKIPTIAKANGLDYKTAIISALGGNPKLSEKSPYLAGIYAVVDAISRTVAMGGDLETVWLTAQEYFWKLEKEDARWGEVYAILLGFFRAQIELSVPAIGGKDSASGTFKTADGKKMHVPTTLLTIANSPQDSDKIVSAEFQDGRDNPVIYFPFPRDENGLPLWSDYREVLDQVSLLHKSGKVASSSVVESGWVSATVAKMCFGNNIGFVAQENLDCLPDIGWIVLELSDLAAIPRTAQILGRTHALPFINFRNGSFVSLEEAHKAWTGTLEKVYSTEPAGGAVEEIEISDTARERKPLLFGPDGTVVSGDVSNQVNLLTKKPKVVIPVFPGTNSELDTKHALHKAGFTDVEIFVFQTKTPEELKESFERFAKLIGEAQMVVLPGGFSGADEPGGSAKFSNVIFRSMKIRDAMNGFLQRAWTLMLGICNGFQMLMKLGVFENGEISDFQKENDMTLAHNTNGRHITDIARHKVTSIMSPFLNMVDIGDTFIIPFSHGEGRMVFSSEAQFQDLLAKGQIVLQNIDADGNPTNAYNGSDYGVAAICSPDGGRIFGMMAHPERAGLNVFKNVPGNKNFPIFDGAAAAFWIKK